MELDRFKVQLKTFWTPAIAVLASDEAENICWDSNALTVGELLRPFGVLRRMNGGLGVPVRTPAEQPIRLHNWMLRVFDIDDMVQPPTEAATQHLEKVLKRAAAGCPDMPLPELFQTADAAAVDAGSPWYPVYCQEFFRMLNFGAHETMDRPVACVLALPSTFQGENPSSAFAELFEAKAPPFLKQAVRDSQVTMHYLFIHDAQKAPAEDRQRAAQALQSLASTSGSAGHVITINSPGHPRADPAMWADCLQQRWRVNDRPDSIAGFATGISQSDAASIAAFVEELAVRKVAPHIESRIRQLDQTVVAARKGFRNQLKSLLFRKSGSNIPPVAEASGQSSPTQHGHFEGGPHSPTSGTPHHYSSSSVEAQMRQLSDLALMVGDCDTALSTLRLLASDYKSDKAYLHFAGVQETTAAATALCDGSSADVVTNLKEAFYRYDQVAQQHGPHSRAAWYATRSAVLLAGYLSAAGRYSDASWIVMKAHFQEDDLRAALLIEQAAQLLRRTDPPRLRKFAFHMVLAGLRYSKGGARDMATRAYLQAVQVYRGRRWEIVEEHVREALGKGAREGGDAVAAVEHFAATLLCPQIPPGLQSLHLSQFADALQAATKQLGYAPMIDLPLPIINTRKVGVSSAGQAGYVNAAAREAPREVWNTLENALGPGIDSSGNWKESSSRTNSRMSLGSTTAEAPLCCCVGEDVGVDVELTNPLGIELEITRLRLSCNFDAAAAPAMGGAAAAAPRGTSPVSPANSPSPGPAGLGGLYLPFQVREEKITLYPGERAVVHLRVRPLRTGSLHIDGVQWQLNGVATGQKAFVIPRRWVTEKASNAALLANVGEEEVGGVDVKVLPPMPRLELFMEDLPSTLLVGQMAKCTLRLKNAGAMTLHALRAAIDVENVLLQFKTSQTVPRRQGVAVTAASSSIRLGVNEELTVDAYIRPTRPGPCTFSLAWYYEPLVKLDALPYRTLRATFSVSVLPALETTGWAGQLPGSDGQRLMVLKGLNLQGIEAFKLQEVEVMGEDWDVRLAGQEKFSQEKHLQARSVVSLEHVVGPESAVVLHMVLSPAASPPEGRPTTVAERYLIDGECRPASQALPRTSSRNGNSSTAAATERPLYTLLRWEVSGIAQDTVEGFNVVRVGRVRGSDGMGVAARLVGPRSVVYDFSAGPAACVDIMLEMSHELPCALEVEWRGVAPPGEEPVRSQRFTWIGLAAGTLQAVTPGTTMRIPLRISVRSAGWVAIEGVWVAWKCKEAPEMSGSLIVPTSYVLVHENVL